MPPPQRNHIIPKAVRCSRCKRVGFAEFEGGFHVKTADKVMNFRPIKGNCAGCGGVGIELVPIPHLTESDSKEMRELYNIQQYLEECAERGVSVPKNALILPRKKLEQLRQRLENLP